MAKWIYNEEKESHYCEKCGSKAPADPTLIGHDCYIEWLSDYCPQCGSKAPADPTLIGYDYYIEWLSDYCPQCGEKMEVKNG